MDWIGFVHSDVQRLHCCLQCCCCAEHGSRDVAVHHGVTVPVLAWCAGGDGAGLLRLL